MLELLGALLLSALAVALAVLGIGVVSENRKKTVEEKTNGGKDSEKNRTKKQIMREHVEQLKAYGLNPHIGDDALAIDTDIKAKGNGLVCGDFDRMTGDITREENEYLTNSHVGRDIHEGFHRAHYMAVTSPTKKLRRELNDKWRTGKENVLKVKTMLAQLPQNLVRVELERKAESADVSSALLYGLSEEDVLKDFKMFSDKYERELEAVLRSEEYGRLDEFACSADNSFKALISNRIYNFLYSENGNQKIEEVCLKCMNSASDKEKIPPQLKNSVRNMFRRHLTNFAYYSNIPDEDGIIDAFKAFTTEQDLSEFEDERKNRSDSFNKLFALTKPIENKYTDYIKGYLAAVKSDYLKIINNTPRGPNNPFNRRYSDLDDWNPLTETFAYYLNVQRGEDTKKEVKEKLLEDYPKNNDEQLKYERALRSISKIHKGLKKYGGLSEEETLKLVLPMSKYIRSVDELEKFVGDEKNISELVQYSKIASNMGEDETGSFGNYRGLHALKHYKNTGKIH